MSLREPLSPSARVMDVRLSPRSPGDSTTGAAFDVSAGASNHASLDYGAASAQEGLIGGRGSPARSDDEISVAKKQSKYRTALKIGMAAIFTGLLVFGIWSIARPLGLWGGGCASSSMGVCDLMCQGVILQTLQFSGLFNDSKTFVDLPLMQEPQCVADDFNSMADYSHASLRKFVLRNFQPSCSDMLLWSPPDYHSNPPFLAGVSDPTLADWAGDVHALWNLLGRRVSPDVYENPQRHTLLPLRSPFMIVPGGRFCEFYYWDSFWIIQGLLVSNMTATARGIVDNFIGMVQDYGFIPNGSRRYYLNRSQPPMLTLMVQEVFAVTQDKQWLLDLLPTLEAEYRFWMEAGTRAVNVTAPDGTSHVLNRYFSNSTRPRPESYVPDSITAWLLHNMTQEEDRTPHHDARIRALNFEPLQLSSMQDAHVYHTTAAFREGLHYTPRETVSAPLPPPPVPSFQNDSDIKCLFAELAAGAESGWDFSSRWFHDRANLTSVETMDLIPVDLNAILFAVEKQLQAFFEIFDEHAKAAEYAQYAATRVIGIEHVLWNGNSSQWQDYHIHKGYWKSEVMLSNFIPLWTKCYDTAVVDEASVISALLQSGLVMDGGLVTTLNNNTQQWDYPNAWAPLQWMVMQGIESSAYQSHSTLDSFRIFNSSALPPGSPPQPASSCDIVRPESWFNCTQGEGGEDDAGCRWCFPPGKDLATAMSLRWLLGNFLAFNSTGYMLEKYFAPAIGNPGAGGEYSLQKGFGWTNGVALHLIQKLSHDPHLNLTWMMDDDYPYRHMAAYVDTSPLLPAHPPTIRSATPIAKRAQQHAATIKHEVARSKRSKRAKRPSEREIALAEPA